MRRHQDTITKATGSPPVNFQPLGGGCVSDVRKVTLQNGREIVAKSGDAGSKLGLEGFMLRYLSNAGGLSGGAQTEAADLLAALHGVGAATFSFDRATMIGGLHQPNAQSENWVEFFRDQRLMFMARQALDGGRLPDGVMARIEVLAGKLGDWLDTSATPSLIHGDLWGGNVLCDRGRISGFIDPAIYYADAEIELAFSTLFATFGDAFFARYQEHRPIRPGFFEERQDLCNLYPLLVHVRLFGGSYVASVEGTLTDFGC